MPMPPVTAGELGSTTAPLRPPQTDSEAWRDVTVNLIAGSYRRLLSAIDLYSTSGLAMSDTLQILLGAKTGICDDFEGTTQPGNGHRQTRPAWTSTSGTESGQTTPRRRMVVEACPCGNLGGYAPIRTRASSVSPSGSPEQLIRSLFWQRYASAGQRWLFFSRVEISTDADATWTLLHRVPDYPFTDRWGGVQSTFALAKVPLAGYSGVVQIRVSLSAPCLSEGAAAGGSTNVLLSGDATCATTGSEFIPLDARYDAARSGSS